MLSVQRTQVPVGPPQGESPGARGCTSVVWLGLHPPCPSPSGPSLGSISLLSFPNKRSLPWTVLSICRALCSFTRDQLAVADPCLPSKHCGNTGAIGVGLSPNTWPDICLLGWLDRSMHLQPSSPREESTIHSSGKSPQTLLGSRTLPGHWVF